MSAGGSRILQVVDTDGTVLWSSPAAGGEGADPILTPPLPFEAGSGTHLLSVDDPELGELRVLAVPRGADDQYWLLIARSEELGNTAGRAVLRAVFVLVPVLTLGVGLLVWFGVGRALRPVESIRSSVGDITEHHLSTRVPVPDTGDEVARLAVTMNEMLDRLDAAAGRERQLVADASHELRSPLASVRALLETRATAADPAAHDAEAMAAVIRLQALVEQLLVLASQDAAVPPPTRAGRPRRPGDGAGLGAAGHHRAHRRHLAGERRAGAGQRGGPAPPGRQPRRQRRPPRPQHRAVPGAARHRAGCSWSCPTTGPASPRPTGQRVFERFTRLDEARDRDRAGAGLGLSIVAGVVARHHGTVDGRRRPRPRRRPLRGEPPHRRRPARCPRVPAHGHHRPRPRRLPRRLVLGAAAPRARRPRRRRRHRRPAPDHAERGRRGGRRACSTPLDGPVTLLGHSYGGAPITVAGNHPAVERLVYLTAMAPDDGQNATGTDVQIGDDFMSAFRLRRQRPARGRPGPGPRDLLPRRRPRDRRRLRRQAAAGQHRRRRPGRAGGMARQADATTSSAPTTRSCWPTRQRAIAARIGATVLRDRPATTRRSSPVRPRWPTSWCRSSRPEPTPAQPAACSATLRMRPSPSA